MMEAERRQLWEQRIEAQEASGLKVPAWCRQEGLDESTFYHHRKRLQASKTPVLIELPMSAKPGEIRGPGKPAKDDAARSATRARDQAGQAKICAPIATADAPCDRPLEVQTPDGFVIRLSARAQLEWLPHLLAVL
jgi:hypothetical protein